MEYQKYFEANQKLWDKKTDVHLKTSFYNMDAFMKGETSLRKIELEELPNLKDKSVLHLQCHFGQDTLSLERMGASCTGIDLSTNAIKNAETIRDELGLKSKFVACNVYDTEKYITDQFDMVFTSYGVVAWLPDLEKWADQIVKRIKPGGSFFMTEFHPVLYMFDWEQNRIGYRYFNEGDPYMEVEEGTYADSKADIRMTEYFWQHPLSDIINPLLEKGLQIECFKEYDYSPYSIFGESEERGDQEHVFSHNGIIVPHVFTLKATKPL